MSVVAAVSPDVLVLLILGVLLHRRLPTLPRWFRGVLASAVFVAASARIGDLIARELLGRPLDPAGDLPHLGNVAEMLGTVASPWAVGLAIPVAALLLAALVAINWWAMAMLAAQVGRLTRRSRVGVALAAGVLLLLPNLSPPGGSAALSALRIVSAPVIDRAVTLTGPPLPGAPDLGGADFYVIFVESYGVAAFEDPERGSRLREASARWAAEAEAAGFDFRSAQIQSPTFGGGSWRAHASLLSGLWLDREARYEALVNSDRVSLVRLFGQAGYRTVAFEPGNQGAWPEGDWYGFDHIYDREGIGYRGPAMGWWEVPDQFTLYALYQQEIRTASRPLFAKVSLITSHIPYWPVAALCHPMEPVRCGDRLRGAAPLGGPRRHPGSRRTLRAVRHRPRVPVPDPRRLPPRVRAPSGAGGRDRGPPAAEALAARQRHLGDSHPSLFPGPGTPWSLGSTRVHPHARSRCGHLMANERFSPRPFGALS